MSLYCHISDCFSNTGRCARLHKAVDSHDGHVRLTLGVVHQVQIHQLLQLQVISLHAVYHIWKQGAEEGREDIYNIIIILTNTRLFIICSCKSVINSSTDISTKA